jgi:hypothetical protein
MLIKIKTLVVHGWDDDLKEEEGNFKKEDEREVTTV